MAKYTDPLSATVVMERADALRDLAHNRAYRRRIPQYRQVLDMTMPSQVPENMARGVVTEIPSPIAGEIQDSVIAETAAYPEYINCTAYSLEGAASATQKDDADDVERWLVLKDLDWDEGKRLTSAVRGRQCSAGWAAVVMTTDPANEDNPWSFDVPDTLTCHPDEQIGGPYVPNEFAQRYRRPIRELMGDYNGKPGPFFNQKLVLRNDSKRFEYVPLGAERSEDSSESTASNASGRGGIKDVEFIRYDDGCYIYHIVRQPGKNAEGKADAEMLWYERNLTGGVSAVIVPGVVNVEGGDGEKMKPILLGILTNTLHMNLLRAVLSTLAFRDRPDTYIEVTPGQLENMRSAGYAVPVEGEWAQGGAPRQIYVDGKPTMWSVAPNPQLDTLYEELKAERQFLLSRVTTIVNPEVAAASTAQAFTLNQGAQLRQQVPFIQHWNWAKAKLYEMVLHTIPEMQGDVREYADSYPAVATVDVNRTNGGAVEKGTALAISAAKLKDMKIRVFVDTKQETEEIRVRSIQEAVQEEAWGLKTHEQVIAVAFADGAAQMQELGTEKALQHLEQTGEALLDPAFQLWLAANADLNMPVGAMPVLGGAAPAGAPGGGQTFNAGPPPTPVAAGNGAGPS